MAIILPPPKEPKEAGIGRNWSAIEEALGTVLPPDYRAFVDLYGTGVVSEFIWIYNPYSEKPHQNLLVRVPEVLGMWRELRAEFGEKECPYPLYPEMDGLLPWGHLDSGNELYWQTSGAPEDWRVLINEARGPRFEAFDASMTEFLTKLLTGTLSSDIIPSRFLKKNKRLFQPK